MAASPTSISNTTSRGNNFPPQTQDPLQKKYEELIDTIFKNCFRAIIDDEKNQRESIEVYYDESTPNNPKNICNAFNLIEISNDQDLVILAEQLFSPQRVGAPSPSPSPSPVLYRIALSSPKEGSSSPSRTLHFSPQKEEVPSPSPSRILFMSTVRKTATENIEVSVQTPFISTAEKEVSVQPPHISTVDLVTLVFVRLIGDFISLMKNVLLSLRQPVRWVMDNSVAFADLVFGKRTPPLQ